MKHDKFKAYWESIGKPGLEYRLYVSSSSWQVKEQPMFFDMCQYRVRNDPHWKLRRKWVESDFKLAVEQQFMANGKWEVASPPKWWHDHAYREAECQVL